MEYLPFLNSDEIDDFQTDKRRTSDLKNEKACHDKYTPLHVKSEWFKNKQFSNQDEELTMTKFGAHIAFLNEDYQKSMNLYRRCKEILPSNANLLLREVCESELRCLLKLERYKEAHESINMLLEEKGNPQDSSLYSMLADVSIAVGQFDAAESLQKCINLHADYAVYWIKVANLYEKLSRSKKGFPKHHRVDEDGQSTARSGQSLQFSEYFLHSFITKKDFQVELVNGKCMAEGFLHIEEKKSTGDRFRDLEETCDNCKFLISEYQYRNDIGIDNFLDGIQDCLCDRTLDCLCCKFIQSCFVIGLNGSKVFQSLARTFLKQFVSSTEYQDIFNDLTEASGLEEKAEIIHFVFWKVLMKITQYCAYGKAFILQQKSVQYSKGFVKDAEYKELIKIQQALLDLTGCKHLASWLI
ncbi:uncharacterized protein LOC135689283 isoform X2 [Rhopilema esculentum]|uniref:uncharacterized protein LOC135689283 isoform X2 n=1 Tax=Rhopilema esculentum TaxID=499914 RepID=UPI0031DEA53A